MIRKITVFFVFLFVATIAIFSTTINNASASPLMVNPTPTPFITYWTGTPETYTDVSGGSGGSWALTEGPTVFDYDDDGSVDWVAPEGQLLRGFLVNMAYTNYNGDNILQSGTNTNWFQPFNDNWTGGANEMTAGVTTCNGTTDACTGVGYAVDTNHDWENPQHNATDDIDWFTSVRVYHQLGTAGLTTGFTLIPIYYGDWECETTDPSEREFLSSGLLLGPDEEGETFDLEPGNEYMLMTNAGPWNDGTDDRYDIAVRFKSSYSIDPPDGEWGEWMTIDSVPGQVDVCNEDFLDTNGTVAVFTTPTSGEEGFGEYNEIQFRVNDDDDEFDDNSGDLEYYWLGENGGNSQGCNDEWTNGVLVAKDDYDSRLDSGYYDLSDGYAGGAYSGRVAPNSPYLYKVVGSYVDNGDLSNDMMVRAGLLGTEWSNPSQAFKTTSDYCNIEENGELYIYGVTSESNWDRSSLDGLTGQAPYTTINDASGTRYDNSGSVSVEWYEASWTAPASDCATKYTIGTFIESPIFQAREPEGREYPVSINGLVEGQVYYIESQGSPYSLNGESSYDFQVKNPAVFDDWQDPEDFFDCITPIDQFRYGYYWTADAETFWLRANTTLFGSYDDNGGSLQWNLYGAIPNEVPSGESCGDYFDLGDLRWRAEVDADSTSGYSIDHSVFTPGEKYAVAIAPSPYTDPDGTGKTGEIRRSAPGTGSVSYEAFDEWGGALCYENNNATIGAGYDVVYFEAETLSDYEVRATEPDGGNSGTVSILVYEIDQTKNPFLGCEYNYADVEAWYVVKINDEIYANNEGVELDDDGNVRAVTAYTMATEFSPDVHNYKIETTFLNDDDLQRWDLQISEDGGFTWVFLEDWVDCWVDLGTGEGRGYFTSPVAGGPFILRVYDVGGVFWNNVGGVNFNMWIDSIEADPGDVWDNPYYAQSWGIGCTASCPSPGFLAVGEYIEYARCRFSSWIAWCPWHADRLTDMQNAFRDVEPFATIMEFISLGSMVRDEVNAYSWNDDGGGSGENEGLVQAPNNFIFMPNEGGGAGIDPGALTGPDSIWGTGEIDLNPDEYISFRTECDTELTQSVGTRLALPMCFAFNVLDQLGLKMWFQLFWDLLMLIALGMYLKKSWVDKLQ